jgi:acyl-CoA thioesterase-1
MGRNIFVGFCLLFCAVFCHGCESEPRIAPFSQDAVILAFGDSLTYGTGAAAGQSYPDILGQLIDRPIVNVGVPGEVSADGLNRLPAILAKYNPSLVILCHGGNDFLRRFDLKEIGNNLKAMVALIRSQGADVVLVGVPRLKSDAVHPNAIGYQLMAEAIYQLIDKAQHR